MTPNIARVNLYEGLAYTGVTKVNSDGSVSLLSDFGHIEYNKKTINKFMTSPTTVNRVGQKYNCSSPLGHETCRDHRPVRVPSVKRGHRRSRKGILRARAVSGGAWLRIGV
jgi:hypothetical protein